MKKINALAFVLLLLYGCSKESDAPITQGANNNEMGKVYLWVGPADSTSWYSNGYNLGVYLTIINTNTNEDQLIHYSGNIDVYFDVNFHSNDICNLNQDRSKTYLLPVGSYILHASDNHGLYFDAPFNITNNECLDLEIKF